METTHDHASADHHEDHGGLGKYMLVFLALCGLTLCSFMTVSDWWPFDKTPTWIFMMGVSCMKAMLVILFFMHLLWEANWKYVLTIPAAMMCVFLLLMLIPDIGCRMNHYSEERTIFAAEPAAEHGHGDGKHAAGDQDGHGDDHAAGHGDSDEGDGHHDDDGH